MPDDVDGARIPRREADLCDGLCVPSRTRKKLFIEIKNLNKAATS